MSQYKFACTQCGQCCKQPGFVLFDDEEQAKAAAFLNQELMAFRQRFLVELEEGWAIEVPEGEACPFLLDDACTIQPVKPKQCRTYPFWPEISREWKTWLNESAHCPGIGQGRAYSERERRALEKDIESTDENY